MTTASIGKLAALLREQRDVLLARWRQGVRELPSAQGLDTPTLIDHIPQLLHEMDAGLSSRSEETIAETLAEGSPSEHGMQRLEDGFDLPEVVAEYSILRRCIHDLAEAHDFPLEGEPLRIINHVIDSAIAVAVQTYATQQALQVQRRREEYLSFVAHDLRTPLNAISLAAAVLEHKLGAAAQDAETPRMLATLQRNVHQLQELVAKVLEENVNLQTEVGVKLQRRTFDLWPLIELLIHDLHPVADTDSTRLVNQVPDELQVYADASLLRRVFQNLIANAIRYTPRGTIEIGAADLGDSQGIECWVRDDGAGIPPDRLEKVFDDAVTDAEGHGGMGLGLAIVKTFVEAHGGQVAAQSDLGVGSVFRFTLPAQEEAERGPG